MLPILLWVLGGAIAGGLVLAGIEAITDYIKNKYFSAFKIKVKKILKSGDYKIVSVGIRDEYNHLLGNEEIKCENVDDLRKGQEIYI